MNGEELDAIRQRWQDTTPGAWVLDVQDGSVWEAYIPQRQIAHCQSKPGAGMMHDRRQILANAQFIAEAHSDIPALLDYIAELESTLEAVEHEVALVYGHFTHGKLTKCNTRHEFVIAVIEDEEERWSQR